MKLLCLEEVAAHLRHEEHHHREHDEEHDHADDVLDRVVRMAVDAVERQARLRVLGLLLDLDAVRVVRADLVQRHQVRDHQAEQHQRQRDHVEGEEAVERDVGDRVVAADPERQVLADERTSSRTG